MKKMILGRIFLSIFILTVLAIVFIQFFDQNHSLHTSQSDQNETLSSLSSVESNPSEAKKEEETDNAPVENYAWKQRLRKSAIDLKDGSVDLYLTGREQANHIYYCGLSKILIQVDLKANGTYVTFLSEPKAGGDVPEGEDDPIYFYADKAVITVTSEKIKKKWEEKIKKAIAYYDLAPRNIVPSLY